MLGRHIPEGLPPTGSLALNSVLGVWHTGGWVGVDLFFVLSGYLVSGLLFREFAQRGQIDVKRFLIRRALRIYPPFYLFLGVTLLMVVWEDFEVTSAQILGELFYLQNYVDCLWPHTWSLAIEEHFYLTLPLVLLLLRRLDRASGRAPFARLPSLCLLLAAGCLGLRLASEDPTPQTLMTPTHLRMDSLACGVVIAYLHRFYPSLITRWRGWKRVALALAGVALLAPAFVWPSGEHSFVLTVGFSLFFLGNGALLISSLDLNLPGRVWRWIAFVGAHSYSIYLWHFMVRRVVGLFALKSPLPTGLWLTVYFVAAILSGIVLARLVEIPSLRLRERLYPPPSGSLPAPSTPA